MRLLLQPPIVVAPLPAAVAPPPPCLRPPGDRWTLGALSASRPTTNMGICVENVLGVEKRQQAVVVVRLRNLTQRETWGNQWNKDVHGHSFSSTKSNSSLYTYSWSTFVCSPILRQCSFLRPLYTRLLSPLTALITGPSHLWDLKRACICGTDTV